MSITHAGSVRPPAPNDKSCISCFASSNSPPGGPNVSLPASLPFVTTSCLPWHQTSDCTLLVAVAV